MKHFCLIFLYIITAYNFLYAQPPVILRSNEFSTGDSVLLYRISGGVLNNTSPGASGSNIFWDFSGLDFEDLSLRVDTICYLDPVGTPFYPITLSADYSQADLCKLKRTNPFDPSNYQYTYYATDNNSISLIGFAEDNSGSDHWEDHCSDFIKELSFPFTCQDSFADSYTRYFYDMSGSEAHYLTGTNTVVADACGSLKAPDGSIINNVIRIHTTLNIKDSNVLFGIQTFTRHYYRWYSPDKKGFILSFEMEPDGTTVQSAEYQKQTNSTTSITEFARDNGISVYPNPNEGNFKISSSFNIINKAEIYNSTGQKLYVTKPGTARREADIRLPNPANGTYFINIYCGDKITARKVLIQNLLQ